MALSRLSDGTASTGHSRGPGRGRTDSRFAFGTKAETLERVRPFLNAARILDLFYFPVSHWRSEPERVLDDIVGAFGRVDLAVRSSALGEDGSDSSMAGAFVSRLGIDSGNRTILRKAIDDVVASYGGNPGDQVLVQPMLHDVAVSGVIMTHDIQRGAPFYVVEYDDESGRTDSITGGTGATKAVLVFRNADPGLVQSNRVAAMIGLARELEGICGPVPLDIEFGIATDGAMYLFQVRRISLHKNWLAGTENRVSRRLEHIETFVEARSRPRPGLGGERTILGIMPDWNPAEIIGTTPRPLATSLYRELVTRDIWRDARRQMGYRILPAEDLMVMIAGHPFIDVRNSFNSFLPEGLSDDVAGALVDAWLDRLDRFPELHDKVEFEVAQTCYDFTFEKDFRQRFAGTLSPADYETFEAAVRKLTVGAVSLTSAGTLERALATIDHLSALQGRRRVAPRHRRGNEPLAHAADMIEECRNFGTLPFAVIARHAFIAESLLRSAVRRGAIEEDRLQAYRRTIRSITSELASDFNAVCCGEMSTKAFQFRYGHLRPGTYDITSLRYDERDDLFTGGAPTPEPELFHFDPSDRERAALDRLLLESGFTVDSESFFEYARRAIAGREDAKFVFTRSLSDALSAITRWGETLGLSRDDLSYLPLEPILRSASTAVLEDQDIHFIDLAEEGRRSVVAAETTKLSYLIRDSRDIYVVPLHRSAPNFIGSGRIEGAPALLGSLDPTNIDLYDRVVCIENADPGYDWIFTKGIKGLVTKFGGANSHMAIRCAEFGLPAAIGCGERTFERLANAKRIEINSADKMLRPLDAV
jgi:hypothetical protein